MQEAPAATFSTLGESLGSLCGLVLPRFLQASLQSKVVSVMKEKCSEAREGGSANNAAKERPFDLCVAPSCSTTFRRALSRRDL